MSLENAKRLFSSPPDASNGMRLLNDVLVASIELVSLDDNDFSWSSWGDRDTATRELHGLHEIVHQGSLPSHLTISVIFAPTGPMQELSMSSGWGEAFVRLADYFDAAERVLWPQTR